MSNDLEARAWVDVDLAALRDNYRAVQAAAGASTAIIPMVKADAYGLGAHRVVAALEPLEPWGYGVATADEGAALRSMGVRRPVVVFGPLPPASVALAAEHELVATISDIDSLRRWADAASAGRPLQFHVEIDSGMGRAGFDWRDTPRWSADVMQALTPHVRWTGVFTHFHGADSADTTASATQWQRFQDALAQLPVSREDLVVHACNSAAALRFPEFAADAVRPGIFLYGGQAVDPGVEAVRPAPVVALRARLVLTRDVPPGSTVGYGATHVARRWERWGTLAIGYGDGLPRRLGNRGSAIVRGRVVPFVGRISMDMTVVDITDVPEAAVGDAATLIGSDGGAEIRLDDVAGLAETISYEILTGLRPRLPRVEKGAWTRSS